MNNYGRLDIYCPACGKFSTNQFLPCLWPEPHEKQWQCPNCSAKFSFSFTPIVDKEEK